MTLLNKFQLSDLEDDELRRAVQSLIDKGILQPATLVSVALANALSGPVTDEHDEHILFDEEHSKGGNGGAVVKPGRHTKRTPRLRDVGGYASPLLDSPGGPRPSRRRTAKKAQPTIAERQASQQLQGKYIAAIRQVPKTRRAAFKQIVATEGREAAIKAINAYLAER